MNNAKRIRANRTLEGQECAWCSVPLAFGDEVALCAACDGRHHAACWDEKGGCALPSCLNAAAPEPAAAPSRAKPAARRRRPRLVDRNAPGAQASLIWGLVGLLVCPLVGIVAILQANQAKRAIRRDRRLEGAGMATAGAVLGWISIAWLCFVLLLVFLGVLSSASHQR